MANSHNYITKVILFFITFSLLFSANAQKEVKSRVDVNSIENKLLEIVNHASLQSVKIDSFYTSDSLTFWKKIQHETNGYVNLDYAYGLNTIFRDSSKMIGSYFNTNGNINTQIQTLPIKLSFNYSSLKVPLGTNNYFRITYDRQKLLQNQEKLRIQELENVKDQIKSLEKQVGKLNELQNYIEVYIQANKDKYKSYVENKIDSLAYNASTKLNPHNRDIDSIQFKNQITQYNTDSLAQIDRFATAKRQRFMSEYEKIKSLYEKVLLYQNTYNEIISKLNNTKSSLNHIQSSAKSTDIPKTKKINWLDAVRKVDVGLTNPQTTALSNQSTSVKGIGTEFQIKEYYLAVSSGLTQNNVMLSTNELSNQLVYNQNVFNKFDFQRISQNGLLSTIKTGWGTVQSTHVLFGVNHLTNTRMFTPDSNNLNPAMGMELDIRLVPKFLKSGALDVVYAKTSINRNLDSSNYSLTNSLFSNYNSNAFLAKYTQNLSRINSQFTVLYRHLDENVNTTVYGYMQPGNRRFSFESRHKIASYLKIGTNYRFEETLNKLSFVKLNNLGISASGTIANNFTYSANLTAVNSKIASNTNWNYLISTALHYYKSWTASRLMTAVNYNDYLMHDSINVNRFSQAGVSTLLQKQNWNIGLSYEYFFQNSSALQNNTNIIAIKAALKTTRILLDGSIKIALNRSFNNSWGGHLQATYEISRFFDFTVCAEKFILGNFYRNYYLAAFERFPYLIKTGLKVKI